MWCQHLAHWVGMFITWLLRCQAQLELFYFLAGFVIVLRFGVLSDVLHLLRWMRARRIWLLVFWRSCCGWRVFRHKLGGCTCCCWRCPDPTSPASNLVLQLPWCVCKSSSSLPPLSFHGIRAWYRLRAEQQAQEAKEGQQEVIISSPFVFAIASLSGALREAPTNDIGSRSCLELFGKHQRTTSDRGAVWSSSGSTSKRHRIEDSSSPRRSYRDCTKFWGWNCVSTSSWSLFWVSRHSCAIRTRCQTTSIKLLVRSLTRTTSMPGSLGWLISLWEKDFGTMWKVRMKTLQSCPRSMPLQ